MIRLNGAVHKQFSYIKKNIKIIIYTIIIFCCWLLVLLLVLVIVLLFVLFVCVVCVVVCVVCVVVCVGDVVVVIYYLYMYYSKVFFKPSNVKTLFCHIQNKRKNLKKRNVEENPYINWPSFLRFCLLFNIRSGFN